MKNDTPPLPKKKPAVFHHPLGFELYDGLAMDLHAMTYAEPMLKEIEELRDSLKFYKERCSADARDAARYQWLRHNSGYWIRCYLFGNVWGHEHKDADLDGLIDEQIRMDFGLQEQKPRVENVSCSQCGRDFGL